MDAAERSVSELRRVAPQLATAATIAEAERTLDLLADRLDSPLGIETRLLLGSFLLESPDGDRADNTARAARLYRGVRDVSATQRLPGAWQAATVGLANSLARSTDGYDEALRLFAEVTDDLRSSGDRTALAVALGAYATALAAAPSGMGADRAEQVLSVRREVEELLRPAAGSAEGEGAPADREQWGRALHNLGVAFAQRSLGARSQNVDSAVLALRQALTIRTVQGDPVGRARTLRALATLYPEWSGADSLADAARLADEARAESDGIERQDARAAARASGWAAFERQNSALNQDLDQLYRLPADDRVPHLDAMIANHRAALAVIGQASMPARWAEWTGGLGRLLGRFPSLGRWDTLPEAYDCFNQALAAVDQARQPRLWRDIAGRLGELGHEIGDWNASYRAHSAALAVSDALFDAAGEAEGRSKELADSRGFALFGSYAAARLGEPEEAARLAENGRSRWMVDLLASSEAIRADAPPQVRAAIVAKRAQIARTEAELAEASASDPEHAVVEIASRLADHLRVDPAVLQTRTTSRDLPGRGSGAARHAELSTRLHVLRAELRAAVAAARPDESSAALTTAQIQEVAGLAGHPIVYVMATVHGAMAVAVPPSGAIEAIRIDELTSDDTLALLVGDDERPGFAQAAFYQEDADADPDAIAAALEAAVTTVGERLLAPILAWLAEHTHERAALVAMGRLGLLPLHAAIDGAVLSYAASARTLRYALTTPRPVPGAVLELVAIGNPERTDVPPLPSARVEARTVAGEFDHGRAATVLASDRATAAEVGEAVLGATHLHLACHAHSRPSDPLASALLLAGTDQLTLGDLLAGTPQVSNVRLAVLSACQTANVEFRRLPDEVIGLPAGLHLAGIPGVVATLWEVDDRATATLMSRFYQFHLRDRLPAADALQRAQRWLRDATEGELHEHWLEIARGLDEPDTDVETLAYSYWATSRDQIYRDPYYWAAFAFSGADVLTGRPGSGVPVTR